MADERVKAGMGDFPVPERGAMAEVKAQMDNFSPEMLAHMSQWCAYEGKQRALMPRG